jgi:hypothetical protein
VRYLLPCYCRTISAKDFGDKSSALRSVFRFPFYPTHVLPYLKTCNSFVLLFIWFSKDYNGLKSVSAMSSKSCLVSTEHRSRVPMLDSRMYYFVLGCMLYYVLRQYGHVLSSYHEFRQVIIMMGHAVVQLVESEKRGFDSRWCNWNFSLIQSFRPHNGPGVDSASNRNEYQEYFLGSKGGRCVGLTTLPP